jgi:uncharacterized membrane protein YbhN (UPF0104 family)
MSHWLRRLLQGALTLGAIVALGLIVEPSALLDSLRNAEWTWVVIALLLLPINLLLDGWVWSRLLDALEGPFSPADVTRALFVGMALGFWTPVRVGEYAGRALYLPNGDRWEISLSVFAQRIIDMAVGVIVGLVLLIGVLAMGMLPPSLPWLAALAIGAGTAALLLCLILVPNLLQWGTDVLNEWAPSLFSRTTFFRRLTPRQGLEVAGGTIVRYIVFIGQFVCLGLAVASSASVVSLFVAAGLTFYAKYLIPSLTVLDLGIREGGAVLFFQVMGSSAAAGLNASLLLFSINVLLPAVLGIPILGRRTPATSPNTSTESAAASAAPPS